MEFMIGLLGSFKKPLSYLFGGFIAYGRQQPRIHCFAAWINEWLPEFWPGIYGSDTEAEVMVTSSRFYNDGFGSTYIANAYVEVERTTPFLRLFKKTKILARFTEIPNSAQPDERLIGQELPSMGKPTAFIRCKFGTSDPRYICKHPEGSTFKYRLIVIPMRQRPIRIYLQESD